MQTAKILDIRALNQALKNDVALEYIYFWGHQPCVDGMIKQTCLSQWFERPFVVDNTTYRTAEHYFMAQKAILFGDNNAFDKIIKSPTPEQAKKIGREVTGFSSKTWDKHKVDIAVKGNFAKFSQNEDLKQFLLNTETAVLVEASPFDKIWGVGLAQDNPNIKDISKWQGLNLLGFVLMQVREQLTFLEANHHE